MANTDKNFGSIRGINFIPSYALDPSTMWRQYDRETVAFELELAAGAGFNAIRIWLSCYPFFEDAAKFLNDFDHFLDSCDKLRMRLLPILFDSCGLSCAEQTPRLVPAAELYRQFQQDEAVPPAIREAWAARLEDYVTHHAAAVRCNAAGGYTALLWEQWLANPGFHRLGREHRKRFEPYAKILLEAHRGDSRIIAWDVMNEPWMYNVFQGDFSHPLPAEFARHFCHYAHSLDCGIPLTVGASKMEYSLRLEDCVDLLSFHSYERGKEFQAILQHAVDAGQTFRKPVLLTEGLAPLILLDANAINESEHVAILEQNLPLLREAGIGWFMCGVVVGKIPFPYTGIFCPNGLARPAARFMAEWLAADSMDNHGRHG